MRAKIDGFDFFFLWYPGFESQTLNKLCIILINGAKLMNTDLTCRCESFQN